MLQDFAWYGGQGSDADSPVADDLATPGPTTRSSAAKEDKWSLDEEALSVATTVRRRLSRMPIKSLVVSGVDMKMVLLVRADDDAIVMGGKVHRTKERQGHSQTSISRKDFITLQCHISDCRQRQVAVPGAVSGQYTERNFVRDFQGGHAGFLVQFSGEGSHSFTRKEAANKPQTFLFLGHAHLLGVSIWRSSASTI